MTALTVPKTAPCLPIMPPELAQQCASFDGMDLVRGTVSKIVITQAKEYLNLLERYHKPASDGLIEAWCRMARYGTAPIDDLEFSHRLFAIRASCELLPGWVWTQETLKRAWRDPRFRFFPTAPDLFEFLDEISQKGLRGTAHVRLLAHAKPDENASAWCDGKTYDDQFQRRGSAVSLASILGNRNAD